VLLEKRDEEVHGQVDVLDQLLLGHGHVADGHAQAQDLKAQTQDFQAKSILTMGDKPGLITDFRGPRANIIFLNEINNSLTYGKKHSFPHQYIN
jgi:hypothetical protein